MKIPFAYELGRAFVPKRFRPDLKKYLLKAGIIQEPYAAFGSLFYLSYIITFVIYYMYFWGAISSQSKIMVFFYAGLTWVAAPLAIVVLLGVSVYFYIDIKIYNRTKKMEEVLADFLQVVSSNLKGGLSFEKSLWMAIKPRFGVLAKEIAVAAKKVMTGNNLEDALQEFSDKYDSPMLKRAVELIIDEIVSGGKVADIIDSIVHDMKKTKELKEEMRTSVLTYMIFISVIVIFIAPILFALSYNLLSVIQGVTGLMAMGGGTGLSALSGISQMSVNKEQFILFSKIAIAVIAIFSSMIVSILEKGSIKGGIKYLPIFVVSSYLFYLLCFVVFEALFSSFIRF